MNCENEVQNRQRFPEIPGRDVDSPEIVKHPRENLSLAHAVQKLRPHRHLSAEDFVHANLALRRTHQLPRAVRIDKNLVPGGIEMLEKKMPRKANSSHRQTCTPRHFHVDNGKRYWNSQPALQHLIQIRISWIVKVFVISREPFLMKKHAIEGR